MHLIRDVQRHAQGAMPAALGARRVLEHFCRADKFRELFLRHPDWTITLLKPSVVRFQGGSHCIVCVRRMKRGILVHRGLPTTAFRCLALTVDECSLSLS